MLIKITVKGGVRAYDGVDYDYDRWLKLMEEGEAVIPVEMRGSLIVVKMHKDKHTGEGVAECQFAGNLIEKGGTA